MSRQCSSRYEILPGYSRIRLHKMIFHSSIEEWKKMHQQYCKLCIRKHCPSLPVLLTNCDFALGIKATLQVREWMCLGKSTSKEFVWKSFFTNTAMFPYDQKMTMNLLHCLGVYTIARSFRHWPFLSYRFLFLFLHFLLFFDSRSLGGLLLHAEDKNSGFQVLPFSKYLCIIYT